MTELTPRERVRRFLTRQPLDRVPAFEHFWPETLPAWRQEGRLGPHEAPEDHFQYEIRHTWCLNLTADLDFGEQIVEETDETKLVRTGNYALMRVWKQRTGTPEHVGFDVTDRDGWNEKIRPHLVDESLDDRRINRDVYRETRREAENAGQYFCWGGLNVFECMHPVCGHEHMLMGMALDPDWIKDMAEVYAETIIRLLERLFEAEGEPDGLFFYEDLGFKDKPFMSPAMYKELVWPAHRRTVGWAKARGLGVILHSCGYVEAFVPGFIEAGVDCLQALEVKAGMDLVKLKKRFGDRLSFMGGLDIRALETNDPATIDAELDAKLPAAMEGGGYCIHTDHSIPSTVEYETYRYFLDRARRIGTYPPA
jgi:uroporphyrinogen decarboxylase